jgi:hypothetical protein
MPAAVNIRLRGNDAHTGERGQELRSSMCYTAELIMRIPYNGMYGWDALMKAMTAVLTRVDLEPDGRRGRTNPSHLRV